MTAKSPIFFAENGFSGFLGAAGFTAGVAAGLTAAGLAAAGAGALAAGFAVGLGAGFAAALVFAFPGMAFFGVGLLAALLVVVTGALAAVFFGAAFVFATVAGLVTFFDFVLLEGADFFVTDLLTAVFFTFDLLVVFVGATFLAAVFFAAGFLAAVFLAGIFLAAAFLPADFLGAALAAAFVPAPVPVALRAVVPFFASARRWPFFASARRRVALSAPAVPLAAVLERATVRALVLPVVFAVARALECLRTVVLLFPLVLVLVFVAMISPCIRK